MPHPQRTLQEVNDCDAHVKDPGRHSCEALLSATLVNNSGTRRFVPCGQLKVRRHCLHGSREDNLND